MQVLKIAVVNVAVAAALLLVIEGGVRLAVPAIGPLGTDARLVQDGRYGAADGLRPGAEGTSNGARFAVDAGGFWRYDQTAADSAWLLLGDSVTMGIGVEPDSTFAGRLAAHSPLRVLNPGLVGYDVADYRLLLPLLLDRHPEIRRVTVFWCLNDLYPHVDAPSDPGAPVRNVGGTVLGFVRRHVRTYQLLKAAFFDRPRRYYEHDVRLYAAGGAVDSAAADLAAMHVLARRRGIAFDVVLLPYEYQLRRADAPDAFAPQRALAAALRARAVPVHDAAPHLLAHGLPPAALYLYGDGIHFSARGHAAVADFGMIRLRSSD